MRLRDRIANRLSGGALVRAGQMLRESDRLLERYKEDLSWSKLAVEQAGTSRSRETIRAVSRQAFLQSDPFIKGAVLLLTHFAFGSGLDMPTAKNQSVLSALTDFWQARDNQQAAFGRLAQIRRSIQLLLDGDLFLVVREAGSQVAVRYMPCDYVKEVVTDPLDGSRVLYYRVELPEMKWDTAGQRLTPGSANRVRFYPDLANDEPQNDPLAETVSSAREPHSYLLHLAVNQIDDAGLGMPEPATSLNWFSEYRRLLEDQATMSRSDAALRNWLLAEVGADTSALQTNLQNMGQAGALESDFGAGGFNLLAGAQYKRENLNTGADDAWQNGRMFRMAGAVGMGLSMHYLADPENANLATSTTMERPVLERITGYQTVWVDGYQRLCDFVLRRRNLPLEYDLNPPRIVQPDPAVMVPAIVQAHDAGLLTQRAAASWIYDALGFDDIEDELEKLEEETAAKQTMAEEMFAQTDTSGDQTGDQGGDQFGGKGEPKAGQESW